ARTMAADARLVRAVSRLGALARARVHVRPVRMRGSRGSRGRTPWSRDPVRGWQLRPAHEPCGADAPASRSAQRVDADWRVARIASTTAVGGRGHGDASATTAPDVRAPRG